ncbi:hypothetical protein TNCV_4403061 [Trichonephila clavipes]|uniref:Uncharacterized protein n=1 Tax=Trichonephila clavipes TaxID=2585209 RepID=A0A8X6S2G9_TRICX|nr:hypothetical protein TNCV_4403061 [Trichonephila clavipes]
MQVYSKRPVMCVPQNHPQRCGRDWEKQHVSKARQQWSSIIYTVHVYIEERFRVSTDLKGATHQTQPIQQC